MYLKTTSAVVSVSSRTFLVPSPSVNCDKVHNSGHGIYHLPVTAVAVIVHHSCDHDNPPTDADHDTPPN